MKQMRKAAVLKYNDPNRVSIGSFQQNLFDMVKEVESTGQRKFITRNGYVVAALMPLQDVAQLDSLMTTASHS